MNELKEIVIADDHSLIRKGLRQVLEADGKFRVIEAENGKEALNAILEHKPDIALLDIEMPEMTGFEVAESVHAQSIPVDIVFLTMFKDETIFNRAMDIGVKGYVLKENTVAEITQCVEEVLKGKYYLSPVISEFLVRRNTQLMAPASDQKGINLLTPSERKLLRKLAEMKTNQEIAKELKVSIKTVQNHRNNICNKLGLKGTHALLKYSIENSGQF